MYAVIKTGGKQYTVRQGERLDVELLGEQDGAVVSFSPVLVVNGDSVLSTPAQLAAASVSATIVGEVKGPKIVGFIYRNKSRYRKRWGHRQRYTTLEVTAITA